MKIRNHVLFNSEILAALRKLSKIDLTIKDSISIAKIIKKLQDEAAIVYPIRDKILADDTDLEKKINDLLNAEFEIELEEKIKLDSSIGGSLSPNDLMLLDFIIEY